MAKPRLRKTSRQNRRLADLRTEREQWGEEQNLHARRLSAAREKNLEKRFLSYTRRMDTAKTIRDNLSLAFLELYRMEQARQSFHGPINIYGPQSTTLFLRGCAETCRLLLSPG